MEVVESRVAGVRADDLSDGDKALQDHVRERNHAIADDDQNAHHTAHQEFVLLHLLWCRVSLDQLEDVFQEVLGEGCDFSGRNDGLSLAIAEEESSLHSNRRICVDDVVVRRQVFDQHRKNLLPLFLGDDTAEGIQVFDGVDLEDGMNAVFGD